MIALRTITHILLGLSLVLTFALTASAHGGETHADAVAAEVHESETAEIKKLETILALLKQIIALTAELRTKQVAVPTYAPKVVVPEPAVTHDHEEMEEHHDEHSNTSTEVATEETTTTEAKLVIEVEAHFGKTHVHVRYTDKPEEMFFVEVPLSDEAGIISGVAGKTGLPAEEIKSALKYL